MLSAYDVRRAVDVGASVIVAPGIVADVAFGAAPHFAPAALARLGLVADAVDDDVGGLAGGGALQHDLETVPRQHPVIVDGNGVATHGVVFRRGAKFIGTKVKVINCTSDGWYLDESWSNPNSRPAGNNNFITLIGCAGRSNGGDGITCADWQANSNAVHLFECDMSVNGGNGADVKGIDWRITGGQYAYNTGWGIRLGAVGDAGVTSGIEVFRPWLESNTMGGITEGYANRNTIELHPLNAAFPTLGAASGSIVETTTEAAEGGSRQFFGRSGNGVELVGTTTGGLVRNPKTNGDLLVRRQGTGKVYVDDAAPLTAVYFDATTGNYISTPDAAALDIVGDITFMAYVLADDWTPASNQTIVSKWITSGNQRSYQFTLAFTGALAVNWTTGGDLATIQQPVGTALGATDGTGRWIAATVDVDNGASGYTARFWTNTDTPPNRIPSSWTAAGSQTTAGVTSIHSGTGGVEIASVNGGTSQNWAGKIARVVIANGIGASGVPGGSTVADWRGDVPATTRFRDAAGLTWTYNGSAWAQTLV